MYCELIILLKYIRISVISNFTRAALYLSGGMKGGGHRDVS
jgi:hypothetical protein